MGAGDGIPEYGGCPTVDSRVFDRYYSDIRLHQNNGGLTPNESERLYWHSDYVEGANFESPLRKPSGLLLFCAPQIGLAHILIAQQLLTTAA